MYQDVYVCPAGGDPTLLVDPIDRDPYSPDPAWRSGRVVELPHNVGDSERWILEVLRRNGTIEYFRLPIGVKAEIDMSIQAWCIWSPAETQGGRGYYDIVGVQELTLENRDFWPAEYRIPRDTRIPARPQRILVLTPHNSKCMLADLCTDTVQQLAEKAGIKIQFRTFASFRGSAKTFDQGIRKGLLRHLDRFAPTANDLVLMARGGDVGDGWDLFDDVCVVQALNACPAAVVTALGHKNVRTRAKAITHNSRALNPTSSGPFENGGSVPGQLGTDLLAFLNRLTEAAAPVPLQVPMRPVLSAESSMDWRETDRRRRERRRSVKPSARPNRRQLNNRRRPTKPMQLQFL
jgi:hypothetical protein